MEIKGDIVIHFPEFASSLPSSLLPGYVWFYHHCFPNSNKKEAITHFLKLR